jgi:hypothetical protein
VRLTLPYRVPTVTPLLAETREVHLNRGQRLIRDYTLPPLEADRSDVFSLTNRFSRGMVLDGLDQDCDDDSGLLANIVLSKPERCAHLNVD